MERSDLDYINEALEKLYQKFDDSFSLTFSDEEITKFKKKIEHLDAKLDQMQELNNLLCDIHNEILDLQNFLANSRPAKEEEDEELPGLQKIEIPSPDTSSASSETTKSSPLLSSATFPNQRTTATTPLTRRQK